MSELEQKPGVDSTGNLYLRPSFYILLESVVDGFSGSLTGILPSNFQKADFDLLGPERLEIQILKENDFATLYVKKLKLEQSEAEISALLAIKESEALLESRLAIKESIDKISALLEAKRLELETLEKENLALLQANKKSNKCL